MTWWYSERHGWGFTVDTEEPSVAECLKTFALSVGFVGLVVALALTWAHFQ